MWYVVGEYFLGLKCNNFLKNENNIVQNFYQIDFDIYYLPSRKSR